MDEAPSTPSTLVISPSSTAVDEVSVASASETTVTRPRWVPNCQCYLSALENIYLAYKDTNETIY